VSSKKQEKDLQRQVELLQARYPSHHVITDIGSAINFKRSSLRTLLERSRRGLVTEIVLAHRDRLCCFAFDLLSYVFKLNDTKIILVFSDLEPSTSSLHKLSEDVLAINTVFICRLQGRRAAEHRKLRKQKEASTAGEQPAGEAAEKEETDQSAQDPLVSQLGTETIDAAMDGLC
ncbi:hypothetical protein HK104_005403, partial [Borealophlyctis nickersoniae]